MESNELYHYGVQGMKWGVRRYQNKDGTLTPKGRAKMLDKARKYEGKANTSVAQNYFARSRKAKLTQKAKDIRSEVKRSDLTKARLTKDAANKAKQEAAKPKPKTVKEMTNEELNTAIRRKQLENQYKQLYPQKVSAGKKFTNSILSDVVIPAGKDAAKQVLTEQIKKKSINFIDSLEKRNEN